MNDRSRDPESTKFGGEARAGQTSSSSGGSGGAREGTMTPDYEGTGDGFLGGDAQVVSGDRRAPDAGGDDRGGRSMPEGEPGSLSARDLQENPSQGESLKTPPGSDADQANEAPHVG